MSRKYKMLDKEGMYFISFATINWIDVYVRQQYFELICENLNYRFKELNKDTQPFYELSFGGSTLWD